MSTIRFNFCPICRSALDAAMPVTGKATPNPGDYTICCYCLVVLQFGERLVVQIPQQVPDDVKAIRTQLAQAKMRTGWN